MKTLLERLTHKGDALPEACFSGNSYDAGAQMALWSLKHYPHYPRILAAAVHTWRKPSSLVKNLFEQYAPWILNLYKGLLDALDSVGFDAEAPFPKIPVRTPIDEECSSFSVASELCQNGPLSGQTKDTGIESLDLYTILNLKLTDGPSILTLAYPGELLGYGFWNNGMSIFRNDLSSLAVSDNGLDFKQFALLALASGSLAKATAIAEAYGVQGKGNVLLSDLHNAACFEFNCGGLSIIHRQETSGIIVHANHPEGAHTAPYEKFADESRRRGSYTRAASMRERLAQLPTPITVNELHSVLSDHGSGRGSQNGCYEHICRHGNEEGTIACTTATVVAEPRTGTLYATKGPACINDFTAYKMR